jgi:hypothetical protein
MPLRRETTAPAGDVVEKAGRRPSKTKGKSGKAPRVQLLASGVVLREAIKASQLLERDFGVKADDVVAVGTRRGSGRYVRCIPIGVFRDGAYRVRRELLDAWGGLSVKNGFLQRSAGFPRLLDPGRFTDWLDAQHVRLVRRSD